MLKIDRIIREPELREILGVSKATIGRWKVQGYLPELVHVGQRAVGWRESAIEAFLAKRTGEVEKEAEAEIKPKTLRDEFAIAALRVTLAHWYYGVEGVKSRAMELAAEEAYAMADTLLAQRDVK